MQPTEKEQQDKRLQSISAGIAEAQALMKGDVAAQPKTWPSLSDVINSGRVGAKLYPSPPTTLPDPILSERIGRVERTLSEMIKYMSPNTNSAIGPDEAAILLGYLNGTEQEPEPLDEVSDAD